MCQTNSWTSIYAGERGNTLLITATRSDGLIIKLVNNLIPVEENLAKQFKSVLDLLEGYRNCKCKQGESCFSHKLKSILEKEKET